MTWLLRGLRNGVLTSRYPARPDPYQQTFPAAVTVTDTGRHPDADQIAAVCPTGAIQAAPDGRLFLDRGRCVLCGACSTARPDLFAAQPGAATAVTHRGTLVVPESVQAAETDDSLAAVRADLAARVRRLRRSVHIRHVDAGSDGSDEWEIQALVNPVYDVHRLGIFLTASPRHADILLVTGAGTRAMTAPLARTLDAMPRPLVVIAAGVDAISGGIITGGPTTGRAGTDGSAIRGSTVGGSTTHGGVGDLLPVDVWAPGNPASPFTLLHAILLALGRLPAHPSPAHPSSAHPGASR